MINVLIIQNLTKKSTEYELFDVAMRRCLDSLKNGCSYKSNNNQNNSNSRKKDNSIKILPSSLFLIAMIVASSSYNADCQKSNKIAAILVFKML